MSACHRVRLRARGKKTSEPSDKLWILYLSYLPRCVRQHAATSVTTLISYCWRLSFSAVTPAGKQSLYQKPLLCFTVQELHLGPDATRSRMRAALFKTDIFSEDSDSQVPLSPLTLGCTGSYSTERNQHWLKSHENLWRRVAFWSALRVSINTVEVWCRTLDRFLKGFALRNLASS